MKQFTLLLATATALLSGLVSAHPGHGAAAGQEADLIRHRDVLNATSGTLANDTSNANSSDSVATDHIPIFKTADCVCPPAVCDSRMNAQSVRLTSLAPPPLRSHAWCVFAQRLPHDSVETLRLVMQTILCSEIVSYNYLPPSSFTDSRCVCRNRYVIARLRLSSLAT